MEEYGYSYEKAFKRAKAITISGAMLMEACKADEGLPEHEKGKKL